MFTRSAKKYQLKHTIHMKSTFLNKMLEKCIGASKFQASFGSLDFVRSLAPTPIQT